MRSTSSNLSRRAVSFLDELNKLGKRFENVPQEIRLFVSGAKPALALTCNHNYANLLMKHYPSITRPLQGTTCVYIFNDYSKMYAHMNNLRLIDSSALGEPILVHTFETLGLALGYPPSACKWFNEYGGISGVPPEDKKNVCVVYYHGMQFCTMQHLLEGNIQWLYDNIQVADEFKTAAYVEYPYFEDENGEVIRVRTKKPFLEVENVQ